MYVITWQHGRDCGAGGRVHRVNLKYVNYYVWWVSGICSVMEINRNGGATCWVEHVIESCRCLWLCLWKAWCRMDACSELFCVMTGVTLMLYSERQRQQVNTITLLELELSPPPRPLLVLHRFTVPLSSTHSLCGEFQINPYVITNVLLDFVRHWRKLKYRRDTYMYKYTDTDHHLDNKPIHWVAVKIDSNCWLLGLSWGFPEFPLLRLLAQTIFF